MEKSKAQIHVSVDDETRKQWLTICDALNGNTQSSVFKIIIKKIHDSISKITDIKHYGDTN